MTKIRELEEAKAKSDGHAAKQTMLLEEELRAARYEAKLKYTKDPSAKRQPGRRKKVLEEEGEVSTEDGEPELTPREMLEIQELEEAARAEAAKARREAEDKKMFEALKQAWTEISKMDANEVTKEEMKEFAIKYKLPFSKQEMKSMRKMELFDRSFQYIRTYGKPAADR